MKLTELETKITPKGTRYLVTKRNFTVARTWHGKPRYYWRNWLPMPRRLNRLWAWLTGR